MNINTSIKTNYSIHTSRMEPSQYKYHAKRNGMVLRDKSGNAKRFANTNDAINYCRTYPDCQNVASPRGSEL